MVPLKIQSRPCSSQVRGAPLAPCSVAVIHLLEANGHLFHLPRIWPGVPLVPLGQVASAFGAKTGASPKESGSPFLQELAKSTVFGSSGRKRSVALSFSFLSLQ